MYKICCTESIWFNLNFALNTNWRRRANSKYSKIFLRANHQYFCHLFRYSRSNYESTEMTWHTFEIVLCLIVAFGCVQINATDNATEVCENVPASLPFVRHPRGCNSYYVCWNGVVYVRDCPDGFMFDASGICEYPRNVDCNQCSPHGQTIIRVFDTCDQFIKCSNGESTRMQCAAGLYFDTNTLTCRQQNEVECVPAPITTTTPATRKSCL